MPPRKPKDPVDEKLPPVDTEPEPPNDAPVMPEPIDPGFKVPDLPTLLGPEPCPHGAPKDDCPLCAMDANAAPAAASEPPADEAPADPEPAPAIDALSDEEWSALAAEAPVEVDLPLDEGEEITGQRVDEDGDLFVVTNFGRKVGISPDGWITVLMGPDIAACAPSDPKPPRASWKDLR